MADLSEYRIFEGVEFREEVKTLMQIFADSWHECREADCSQCKYRHGKKQYTLMACLSERYAEKLIAADVAPVRHGRWDGGYTKTSDGEWVYSTPKCTVCGSKSNGGTTNFCPYCGCKMLEDSDGKK